MYRKAVRSWTQLYGASHASTAASVNNLAICLSMMDRFTEAEPLFRSGVGASNSCPHRLCSLQSAPAVTPPFLRRALDVRTKLFGANHPMTLNTANNLASCSLERKRMTEERAREVMRLSAKRSAIH